MQDNYKPALEMARQKLQALDPAAVAERSGVDLVRQDEGQRFQLLLLGKTYVVSPSNGIVRDATGAEAGVSTSLVILHYLATADGSHIRREWIPFRSVPGGNVYEQAFRHQCIDPLVATFGRDPEALQAAAEGMGGTRASMGDLSYVFKALPRIPMSCVLWLPDEEQGAEVALLYDAVAPHYLPTEDLAALGRMLTFGLIRMAGSNR